MINWINSFLREVKGNPALKSKIILIFYRLSSVFFSKRKNPLKYLFIIFVIFYYSVVEMLWGVEIKPKTKIGWGLIIYHPTCIIINPGAVLGINVILRHGITIGNKYNRINGTETSNPIIGNNVEFGAYACVIGPITIGDNCVIGATTYVDFDVKSSDMVVPHRGIAIRKKNE